MRPPVMFIAAALVEIATLVTLLGNLALIDNRALAAAIGPVHGICYLLLVLAAALGTHLPRSARIVSLIPGIGGLLSLWLIRRHRTTTPDQHITAGQARPNPNLAPTTPSNASQAEATADQAAQITQETR